MGFLGGNGGILGAANVPTFNTATGRWSPTYIARQYRALSSGLKFPPNTQDANFSSVSAVFHLDEQGIGLPAYGNLVTKNPNTLKLVSYNAAISHFGAPLSLLDGNSTSVQFGAETGFAFGTGDFTIELWLYMVNFRGSYVLDFRSSISSLSPGIFIGGTGDCIYDAANTDRITGTAAISASTWTHIAAARTSTSTKLFVAGTQVGSTYSDSNNYVSSSGLAVGNNNTQAGLSANSAGLGGYVAEVRITKGFCRYTTTFTPPTVRFPDF